VESWEGLRGETARAVARRNRKVLSVVVLVDLHGF
jgi:hypothetical protein